MGVSTKYGNRVDIIKSIACGLRDSDRLRTYLELGVRRGKVFNAVAPIVSKAAYAVDIDPETYNSIKGNKRLKWHQCTTDQFFEKIDPSINFDMVFIDADHSHESSMRDFDNVKDLVSPNGLILLHDTYPHEEKYFSPKKCNDTYKTAEYIRANYKDNYEIVTLPMYLGISIVRKADRQLMWR